MAAETQVMIEVPEAVIRTTSSPCLSLGGGLGSGAIAGEVNVFVIDADTNAPISNADVRIGIATIAEPLTGTTDTAGLAVFSGAALRGPQTITVTASGYATSTWIGANGANITIPLEASSSAAEPTATASGTIEGWASMPAPASNHYYLAYAGYSMTADIRASENKIVQPSGNGELPPNACVYVPTLPVNECNWLIYTRTGPQAHYAVILDGDSKGTLTNFDDDTYEVIGFAIKTGLHLDEGAESTGEVLAPVPATDFADVMVRFAAAPAGLDDLSGFAVVRIGDEGLIPVGQFSSDITTGVLPTLNGELADGSYDFVAQARPSAMAVGETSSFILRRGVNIAATVDTGDWLPTPLNVSPSDGTYSFEAPKDANLHTVEFLGATGEKAWSVTLLDGSTSFSLPALAPDPLPAGEVILQVNAFDISGLDLKDFAIEDFTDSMTRTSANYIIFTR